MSDADHLINTALQRGVQALTHSTNRLNGFRIAATGTPGQSRGVNDGT